MFKTINAIIATVALAFTVALTGCDDATVVSQNISKDADNFKVERRIVFYNGFTGEYMLTIEGLCSLDAQDSRKISVICKVGPDSYKKHYLGLSDNVTYFIEHMEPSKESAYHYKVVFKPSVILPDVQIK